MTLAASERRVVRVVHVAHRGEGRLVGQPRFSELGRAAERLLAPGGERVPRDEPSVVVAIGEAS